MELCSPATGDFATRALTAPIYTSTELDSSPAFAGVSCRTWFIKLGKQRLPKSSRKVRSCWQGDVPDGVTQGSARLEGSCRGWLRADPER